MVGFRLLLSNSRRIIILNNDDDDDDPAADRSQDQMKMRDLTIRGRSSSESTCYL